MVKKSVCRLLLTTDLSNRDIAERCHLSHNTFGRYREQLKGEACNQLAGARKAYPSNAAKVLGLSPPKNLVPASEDNVRCHLQAITKLLGISERKGPADGHA